MLDREFILLLACVARALSALDYQDPDQFHIQTDEDDERYFLYQTHNGQYRKERRLRDGSVVGTTGWVGADGYLRLQDYIADDQGYRIYKSKTVYVGQNRPIGESIKIAKTAPADQGFGLPRTPPTRSRGSARYSPASPAAPAAPSYPPAFRSTTPRPLEVSITPPPAYRTTPAYTSPNSIGTGKGWGVTSDGYSKTGSEYVTTSPLSYNRASTQTYPPTESYPDSYLYRSSTPAPISVTSTGTNYSPTTPAYAAPDSPTKFNFKPITGSEALASTSDYENTNSVDDSYYGSGSADYKRYDTLNPNSYRHASDWQRRQGVTLGDGYTPQYPGYDGAPFRPNSFRYYLPKQYHEEVSDDVTKTGSFGYVDPFGIRRVIYYNSSPNEGFKVRKNNRFVGHNATPYDPRPVD